MGVHDVEMGHRSEETTLSEAVRRLYSTTFRLRVLGIAVFAGTVLNLGFLVYVRASERHDDDFLTYDYREWVLALALLTGAVLVLAVMHDQVRRAGDTLFEEISDEVQWHRQKGADNTEVALERPLLEIRVALRRYSVASDLPLVRGRAGAAVYAAVNLAALAIIGVV